MAKLVFSTLRIGFPTAEVHAFLNPMPSPAIESDIRACMDRAQVSQISNCDMIHHDWIKDVPMRRQSPFYLLDTDVIFYRNFEQYSFSGPLAGWRIPEWRDDFSVAITRARLHPSLLYVDPMAVREALGKFSSVLPEGPFTPFVDVFDPLCVPFKEQMYFYDTCSLLYHAIGGTPFTDEQKNAYCHFNFGTIPDLVLPRLKPQEAAAMVARRSEILLNPSLGLGAWREQEDFYANHQL